jgi:hypothetical protein
MAEFDHGVKMISSTTGRYLARLAQIECRSWEPIESTLQATTERLADRVFRASQGRERFVVYFEFLAAWKPTVLWSTLSKSGLLSEREQLPTRCILLILKKAGYRPQQGTLRLTVDKKPTQQLWFTEVLLWEQKPQAWWEDVPGLMALFPLCDHQRQPQEAIRHAAGIIERTVSEPVERADWLYLLGIFGELAYSTLDVKGIIGRARMKKSSMWREASLEGKREMILDVLQARFPTEVSQALAERLENLQRADQLTPLVRLAATCDSLQDFTAALTPPKKKPGKK